MRDSNEVLDGEAPATSTEEQLGCFLEEAMNLAQSGGTIDVAALLTGRPDLIDRGRRLVEGLETCIAEETEKAQGQEKPPAGR